MLWTNITFYYIIITRNKMDTFVKNTREFLHSAKYRSNSDSLKITMWSFALD